MGAYGRSRLVVLERFGQVIQIPDRNATEIHDDVAFARTPITAMGLSGSMKATNAPDS